MSYSNTRGNSQVQQGNFESNRGIENPQAQQIMDSLTGYLTNAFNNGQSQAVSDANNALSGVLNSGGQNPYLQETIQSIKDNAAADLNKAFATQYANVQGLGETAKAKALSDVDSQNQLQQNQQILQAINDSFNAGQDRVVNAAQAASGTDPLAQYGNTAAALITNLTKEWGYQPVTTSTERREAGGIKN